MKTILQKNTQRMSGTSYPGILAIKKKWDVDNNKAQFQTLDTWLKDELIYHTCWTVLIKTPALRCQSSYHAISLTDFPICMVYPLYPVPAPALFPVGAWKVAL
jgi:hypothetical protein